MSLEESRNKPVPLKQMYRAQLVEKLQAAGVEAVTVALEEHQGSESDK